MAQQKFFSGLTEGMINRSAGERPDRQKTHFFWPDEYAPDVEVPKARTKPVGQTRSGPPPPQTTAGNGRADDGGQRGPGPTRPSATINGRLFGSQEAGVDEVDERAVREQRYGVRAEGEELMVASRGRLLNNTASHIQFNDGVESSFGELERSRAHERRRIEQFLRQQSEEDTGEAARAKRLSTLQSKIEFYDYPEPAPSGAEPRVIVHRVFGGSGRSVVPDSPPRSRTASRQGHPGLELDADSAYQDDEFEFDDRSSVRSSVCSSSYAPSQGYHRTAHTDLPEHKRNSQRHLRSSINFHNGCTIADDSEAPRKTEYGHTSSASSRPTFPAEPEMSTLCTPPTTEQHVTLNRTLQSNVQQYGASEYLHLEPPAGFADYQPSATIKQQHQLQYIDYKLHYGLRYNPRYDGSKVHVQKHPPAKGTARNATKAPPSTADNPVRERKKLIPQKQYEPPAVPLLSVINIITFVNGPCVPRKNAPGHPPPPPPVASWTGICYHEKECNQLNGIPMDTCAGGFGVCCVCTISPVQYGCDSRTEQNISYFRSPHFPAPALEALPCSFTLALHRSVRQVLLEFLFFELQPPQLGNCIEDQFVVSIQNDHRIYPVLCGVNSGQHMYLDIDRAYSHLLFLNAVFSSRQPRAFLIKITQLSTPRAPMNCLQFHDGLSGVVKSFNYDNFSTVVKNRKASYLNNLNYALCIKRHVMFCNVVFTNVNALGKENIFQMVNIAEDGSSLVPPNQAGIEIFSCPDDYIAINYIRLCGERLNDGSVVADFTVNSPVSYTSAGPIVVAVRTDESTVGRGFKLTYKQNVCIDKIV